MSVGSVQYCWEDVVLAAQFRGDWAALEARGLWSLEYERRLDRPELRVNADDLEEAANEFRYARDLLSAEQKDAWLDRVGLDVEAWTAYIRRALLRTRAPDQVPVKFDPPFALIGPVAEEILHAEVACSGLFEEWVQALAARAAIQVGHAERVSTTAITIPPAESAPGFPGLSDEHCREKFEAFSRFEASFRQFRSEQVTDAAVRRRIDGCTLAWTRFRVQALSFPTQAMAAEAALCIREDATSLEEVASSAGQALIESEFYLEEVADDLADRLLALAPGGLLGPATVEGEYRLIHLLQKVPPSPDNADIQARAADAVFASAVAHEISKHVRWAHES